MYTWMIVIVLDFSLNITEGFEMVHLLISESTRMVGIMELL